MNKLRAINKITSSDQDKFNGLKGRTVTLLFEEDCQLEVL